MDNQKLKIAPAYKKMKILSEFNTDNLQFPLVLSVPHSGQYFPPEFVASTNSDVPTMRRNEDLFVDELLQGAVEAGLTMLKMEVTRAFVDLNRDKLELDPTMFYNYPKEQELMFDKHCRAGLGVIHRINYKRENLYAGLLDYKEVQERLKKVYDVYHNRLQQLIDVALKKFGFCLVLDCHSMPSKICSIIDDRSGIDICLGNLFSQSCPQDMSDFLAGQFWNKNYNVEFNCPYSGAYITFNYCQPRQNISTLQLEINRGLYADEDNLCKGAGFDAVASDVSDAVVALAQNLARRE